tara:strand:+ start:98 stop:784 length:687 start_codon:yes stop_codon:yes gene_type:complete
MKKKIIKRLKKTRNNWNIENKFHENIGLERLSKFLNHYELLKKTEKIRGAIIEFGVLKASSLIRFCLYRDFLKMNKKILAFDAFGSFPKSYKKINNNSILKEENKFAEIHDKYTGKGYSLKKVDLILKKKKIKNYQLIKGDIFKTLKKTLKKNKKINISFLHLDLDVYLPTLFCLNQLYNNVSKGGIILIDDFKTHPGATKATLNFLKKKGKKIKVMKNMRSSYYIQK